MLHQFNMVIFLLSGHATFGSYAAATSHWFSSNVHSWLDPLIMMNLVITQGNDLSIDLWCYH